jgi:hypothetical protein
MSTGLVNDAVNKYNPTPDLKPQTYTAETREVSAPTETVAGQVDSILAKDSPLMQRARTIASQQMNQRGLVNSSMAQGAGVAAMIDRATPIAQQDAQTFSNRSLANMDATNQQNQFNVGQTNQLFQQGQDIGSRFSLQKDAQTFNTGEREASQEFSTNERLSSQDFNERMQQLQEAGVNNRFDMEQALKSNMFNVEQLNNDRRQLQQNEAEFKKLGIQLEAQRQDIPTTFAANISNTAMTGVNTILSDPKLSGATDGYIDPATGNYTKSKTVPAGMTPSSPKTRAISNIVTYANSQLEWASKFFNTPITPIQAPK